MIRNHFSFIHFVHLLCLVCIELKFEVGQDQRGQYFNHTWEIGTCSSVQATQYGRPTYIEYFERCCLKPGPHTLTCQKVPHECPSCLNNVDNVEGWGDNSLIIQGQRYCDDFIGVRAMRRVNLLGKCK